MLQIGQRVWLALVLHHLGHQGLHFDAEGQIRWQGGGRGASACRPMRRSIWPGGRRAQTYAASFRQPDGSIRRGKGRRRWDIYRLTVHPDAAVLFARRARRVDESVALIVASEIFATQPQPRAISTAATPSSRRASTPRTSSSTISRCSPEHGVISLDDVVPSEQLWEDVLERRIWTWQIAAHNRLGRYLFAPPKMALRAQMRSTGGRGSSPNRAIPSPCLAAGSPCAS